MGKEEKPNENDNGTEPVAVPPKADDTKGKDEQLQKIASQAADAKLKADEATANVKLQGDQRELFSKMYLELEKSFKELSSNDRTIEQYKEQVTALESMKKSMNEQVKDVEDKNKKLLSKSQDDLRAKEEVITIKEKQLEEIERRLGTIEEERQRKVNIQRNTILDSLTKKYVNAGIVEEGDFEKKKTELSKLSESALEEVTGVLDRRLGEQADRVTQPSAITSGEAVVVDKPRSEMSSQEITDMLFQKMQGAK